MIIFLFSHTAFARTNAEDYISSIEELKEQLALILSAPENEDSAQKRQLRHELYTAYAELEKAQFSINSEENEISFLLDDYDPAEQAWPLKIKSNIYKNYGVLSQTVFIPYNVFSGKKFIPSDKMTSRQKQDYEETVNKGDLILRSGERKFRAEVKFKIRKWDEASQYRFAPEEISIYLTRDNSQTLLVSEKIRLDKKTFTVYPQIEVRNETQKNSDIQKNALLVREEAESLTEKIESQDDDVKQKGRRSFYFSLDTKFDEFSKDNLDYKNIKLSTFTGTLTFGMGSFFFGGISVGFDLDSINSTSIYEFGLELGANVRVTRFLRPYLHAGAGLTTANRLYAKAGAGLDLTFGHFMLTAGYDYQLRYKWKSVLENGITVPSEGKTWHTLSVGMGVTW